MRATVGKLHVDVHPATIIPLSPCKLRNRVSFGSPSLALTPTTVTYAWQRVIILVICLTELCKIAQLRKPLVEPGGSVTCEHSNFVLRYKYSYALKSAEQALTWRCLPVYQSGPPVNSKSRVLGDSTNIGQ